MESENKSKRTSHVSVLDEEQLKNNYPQTSNKKMKIVAWLFFLLMLVLAFMQDGNVLMLSIPEFKFLKVDEGMLSVTRGGRRTTFLTIENDNEQKKFTCWITTKGLSDCLDKQQSLRYVGKHVKVYSYNAVINGIFHENRLMQLEVNGETVISYEKQSKRYKSIQKNHFYTKTIFCFISLIWLVVVYLKNTDEN